MGDGIVLSKIAKFANESEVAENDNALIVLFKNKKFILLDEFADDATEILELISHAERFERKEFEVASIGEEQYLVALYMCPVRNAKNYFIEKLLATVYPNNYKTSFSSSIIEKNALNAYVTTRLFEDLQVKHNENIKNLSKYVQQKLSLPSKFLPTLRKYQEKSILWMLKREVDQESFPPLFEKLVAKDNETIVYKHLYSRYMQKESPEDITLPPGGILADEMGLGKTVEMLALILLNSRSEIRLSPELQKLFFNVRAKRKLIEKKVFCICNSTSSKNVIECQKCNLWQHKKCTSLLYDSEVENDPNIPYLCPSCWQNVVQEYGLLKTKATFIVSPNTIKMQWLSEIKRHIQPTLRVFLYEGTLAGKWTSPLQLAEYDIVLTDYNVLRKEFYHTEDNSCQRTMRNKPRCMRANTPLLMLDWWRVVLDEAQMFEPKQSKAAAIVRMIPAINRWAVTGTPIQKSLDDLQPLLQFIGFEAASESFVWQQIVNNFFLNEKNSEENHNFTLVNVLQKCMWRTCKSHIASELDIPPQREVVHRIQFDDLELLFYNEQHAECRSKFLENVLTYSQRMAIISPRIMNIILQPFLKIRQSCTIPVVMLSSNANHNLNSQQQKQFLRPQELNEYLKSANEITCKTNLRALASAHNGLAALYFLQKNVDKAFQNYEAVLKLANDYSNMNIGVDSLLQIHALHNIMQIQMIQSDMPIKNLKSYETLYNQLEWKYLSTYAATLTNVKTAYEAAVDKVNLHTAEDFIQNMAEALEILSTNDELILIQKLQDESWLMFQGQGLKIDKIVSSYTLLYIVKLWFQKLINILKKLQIEIKQLEYFTENVRSRNLVRSDIWKDIMQLVHSVYDCHLSEIRKTKKEVQNQKKKIPKKKELCKMCRLRDFINTFECLLFDKVLDEKTNYTEGLENPSFEMYLCKLTFHFIKNKYRILNTAMEKNWSYLENLQLVCKRLIKFWIEMEYTIKAYDELNMCKMRITLTNDVSDKSIFKIRQIEIDQNIIQQQSDLMNAQNQFRISLARLRYIKHLEGDDEPAPCPICHLTEHDRYAVLECGHHICFPCLKSIRIYSKGSSFKCSVCRNIQQNKKIYYVTRAKKTDNEKIRGHYSSKISYIVRLILKLQKENEACQSPTAFENNVKILIFSQWELIIKAIALALKENDIKYRAQCTPQSIEEFKNPNLGITCLLMPFVRGSKGLNLVEATHVFLVEPILNPGEELQAIGRVHRFGQKRETTVHRFIVDLTIEENIYNFIVSSPSSNLNSTTDIQSKWEFDNITLTEFENFFSLPQISECD